MGETQDFRGD